MTVDFPVMVVALTFYVVVAGSTVIVPVVGYAIAAERIDDRLERGRKWIERHQSATTFPEFQRNNIRATLAAFKRVAETLDPSVQ